eukprot:10882586-Alexandrium_andersonii.AAC.1
MFAQCKQGSKTFRMPTHFFDCVSALHARLQAARLCLCVNMVSADLDTERQEPTSLAPAWGA